MTDEKNTGNNSGGCGCKEKQLFGGTAVAFPVEKYRELFPHGLAGEPIGDGAVQATSCASTVVTKGKGKPFAYKLNVSVKDDCPEPSPADEAKADLAAEAALLEYAETYCSSGNVKCVNNPRCVAMMPLKFTVTSRDKGSQIQSDKTKKTCTLTTSYTATVACVCA